MKLDKKGFVASAVLYSLLLLFLALILGLLALLSNRKNILDKLKSDIKRNITKINVFDFYENGTIVYYNPVTGKVCSDYTEDNSTTGVNEGCLKWYIFNDNANNASVKMILDHNTTALVAWNSSGNINDGMNEVKTALESDTIGWKQTARLISADEVAQITGADKALKWSSIKEIGTSDCDINIQSSSYYLDGSGNPNNTYSKTDGWQHKLSTVVGSNKFYWLFDYMNDCTSSGCMINDSSTYGYWTSTPRFGTLPYAWMVERSGWISTNSIDISQYYGVRPVISVSKNSIAEPVISSKEVSVENNIAYLNVTYNVDNINDITSIECISSDNIKDNLKNNTCSFPLTDEKVSMCVTNQYGKYCSESLSLVKYLIKDGNMLVDFSTKNANDAETATLTKKTNYLNMSITTMSGTRQGIYTTNPIDLSLYENIYIDASATITVSSTSTSNNPAFGAYLYNYPDIIDKTSSSVASSSYYSKKGITSDSVTIERTTRKIDVSNLNVNAYFEMRKNVSTATINTNIYNIYMLKK